LASYDHHGTSMEEVTDRPLEELVVGLNHLYHEVEARYYDRRHAEIWVQEEEVLRVLLGTVAARLPSHPVSVLDFACGTGFAISQAINVLGVARIRSVVCIDLSERMLAYCRERIEPQFQGTQYLTDLAQLRKEGRDRTTFDLILTNSALHHLYDWRGLVRSLSGRLRVGGLYLMGHEPSMRFYVNKEIQSAYARFLREWKWRRLLSSAKWKAFVRRKVGLEADVPRETARLAYERGLVRRPLSAQTVQSLVDYHVPIPQESASSARGFDIESLEEEFYKSFGLRLVSARTYAYLGSFIVPTLPRKWREVVVQLTEKYPRDGSSVCALWRKEEATLLEHA
jgi:SAM-dependent methyltransferase